MSKQVGTLQAREARVKHEKTGGTTEKNGGQQTHKKRNCSVSITNGDDLRSFREDYV